MEATTKKPTKKYEHWTQASRGLLKALHRELEKCPEMVSQFANTTKDMRSTEWMGRVLQAWGQELVETGELPQ